jgi:hypothetical protein
VRPLGLVQLQGAGDAVEHALGDASQVASLQPGVVIDADTGQERDLLPAQPGDAAVPAERRQAHLLRRQPGPARGKELAGLAAVVHVDHARDVKRARDRGDRPCQYR